MTRRLRLKESDGLTSAIKPYLKYYKFVDSDKRLFAITGMHMDDIAGFHPGDVEDGCTFTGYLIAKDMTDTALDTLLVFENEEGRFIVGSTVGGMVVSIDLESVFN